MKNEFYTDLENRIKDESIDPINEDDTIFELELDYFIKTDYYVVRLWGGQDPKYTMDGCLTQINLTLMDYEIWINEELVYSSNNTDFSELALDVDKKINFCVDQIKIVKP